MHCIGTATIAAGVVVIITPNHTRPYIRIKRIAVMLFSFSSPDGYCAVLPQLRLRFFFFCHWNKSAFLSPLWIFQPCDESNRSQIRFLLSLPCSWKMAQVSVWVYRCKGNAISMLSNSLLTKIIFGHHFVGWRLYAHRHTPRGGVHIQFTWVALTHLKRKKRNKLGISHITTAQKIEWTEKSCKK